MRYRWGNPYIKRTLSALLSDAVLFVVSAAAAYAWVQPDLSFGFVATWTGIGVVATIFALSLCDAYRPSVVGSGPETFGAITLAMGLASGVALLLYFFVPAPAGAIATLAHAALLYFPLMLFGRSRLGALWSREAFRERMLVLGASDLSADIMAEMAARQTLCIDLVGILSDRDDLQGARLDGVPVLGRCHEVGKVIERERINRVVVASRDRGETFPQEELLAAKFGGVRVVSGVEFFEQMTGRMYLPDLRASYLIFESGFQPGLVASAVKRACDVVLGTAGLVLSAPILGIAALAIKAESPGPVFFSQPRVGRGGRIYRVRKLRSMRDNAEEDSGPKLATGNDPRVTRVGRFLRLTRLDEVPQFWNVLLGDMSVVGPRPERPEFVETLNRQHRYFQWRSCVRPGITGWAQVRFGYVNQMEAFEHKLAYDLFYLKHQSLAFDFLILWETVKTVVLFRGL